MVSSNSTNTLDLPQKKQAEGEGRFTVHQMRQIWGMIFLAPWVIGFMLFTFFPILASLALSFTDYNLNDGSIWNLNWIGFDNYVQMLTTDPLVATSLNATFRFGAIALPLSIILPVSLAALLNNKQVKGKRILRTLIYMPFMVPLVSGVAIWQGMLNSEAGWINRALAMIGVSGPSWLNDINWIYPAMNIMGLWGVGNAFLITLASMQGVPTELYEAATVDGAGPFRRFTNITLPMISPVIFYNLVLTVIGLFRYFEVPYILSQGTGQPGGATMFFNIHLYKTAFIFKDMGYGSALAWLLFAIAFTATVILFITSRYWVYYASGEEF